MIDIKSYTIFEAEIVFSAGLLRGIAIKRFMETTLPFFDVTPFWVSFIFHASFPALHKRSQTASPLCCLLQPFSFCFVFLNSWPWLGTMNPNTHFIMFLFPDSTFIFCYSWFIKILITIFILLLWRHCWSYIGGCKKKILKMVTIGILQHHMELLSQTLLWLTLINP